MVSPVELAVPPWNTPDGLASHRWLMPNQRPLCRSVPRNICLSSPVDPFLGTPLVLQVFSAVLAQDSKLLGEEDQGRVVFEGQLCINLQALSVDGAPARGRPKSEHALGRDPIVLTARSELSNPVHQGEVVAQGQIQTFHGLSCELEAEADAALGLAFSDLPGPRNEAELEPVEGVVVLGTELERRDPVEAIAHEDQPAPATQTHSKRDG